MHASSDPVFVACWTTGPHPQEDGIWFLEAHSFLEEEGPRAVVPPTWCSPFAAPPAAHASERLAAAGITGERLRELPSWREALPPLFAELEARPVVVAGDREDFLERFRFLCPGLVEPTVLDVEGFAAFLHPRRGASSFAELHRAWCGRAPAQDPRAEDLRRLVEALLVGHAERPAALRQLVARALDDALADTAREGSPAHAWLALARRLLDAPSRLAASASPDLSFATLRDGAFEDDLDEAPLDAERTLQEVRPRFQEEYDRHFADADPLSSRAEEDGPLPDDARRIQEAFFDRVPRTFAREHGREAAPERPGQRALGAAVAAALADDAFLLADAPTGTGKTLAYLAPLLLWSVHRGVRVAVSTYTRALQEQAFFHEIPRAQALLAEAGLPASAQPRVSLLKGRANYVCGRAILDAAPDPDGASLVARVTWMRLALFWAEDPSADLDGFPVGTGLPAGHRARVERAARRKVDEVRALPSCCRGKALLRCAAGVRTLRAERSHVVVTNHAFVLARPEEFSHLVFDECDHLHEVTISARSWDVELDEVSDLARELQRSRGRERAPLARLRRLLERSAPGDVPERLQVATADAQEHCAALDRCAEACTREVRRFEEFRRQEEPGRTPEEAAFLLHEYLESGRGDALATALHDLRDAVDGLDAALRTAVEELGDLPVREARKLRWTLRRPLDRLGHWHEGLHLWLGGDSEEADFSADLHFEVSWDRRRRPLLALKWLLPQRWLGEVYFPSLRGAALVSATARVRDGFRAMKGYLGLDVLEEDTLDRPGREVRTFAGPPTFDPANALFCVPEDAPPYAWRGPDAEHWLEYVQDVISFLAERTRGRVLGLFTNRALLARVGERLAPRFRACGVPLYWQGMPGMRKEEIMRRFRAETGSVLLGLDTFWYGVDFPGETCEYVVIPKLPYGAPDRYMIAQQARMGRGPHRNRIYLPKALAMFRQGCGRLLRSEDDRGAVLILDRRVLEKRHADFLRELPRGAQEWQEPELVVGDTDACLRRVFAHMRLQGELQRRGLDPSFAAARGGLRDAP